MAELRQAGAGPDMVRKFAAAETEVRALESRVEHAASVHERDMKRLRRAREQAEQQKQQAEQQREESAGMEQMSELVAQHQAGGTCIFC